MEFKHPPRDVATEAPANHVECKDFCSRALQHSKVHLTWDEDEPLRAKTLKRTFYHEQLQLAQLDNWKDLLSSGVSGSDDQPNKRCRKPDIYRALLLSSNGSDEDDEHDDVRDMEVKFNTGVEGLNKHIREKKEKKSETVWDAYPRKRREKKKARKNKSKYSSDDGDSKDTDQEATEEADDFFIEEPAVKKKKKKAQGLDGVVKAELELLLADDKGTDPGLKGYNLKFKNGKGKKRENAVDEGKLPNSAYDDPRFAALFLPDYAIDSTDPQFKSSATHARQLAQKQQKGHMELSAEREHTKLSKGVQLSFDDAMMQKGEEEELDVLKSKKDEYELSSLVKSIKMKSKQVRLSSIGKTRKDGNSQFKGREEKRH